MKSSAVRSIARILRHASQLKWYYIGIASISVILALLSLLTPWILKLATDEVVAGVQGKGRGISIIIGYAIALMVVELLSGIFSNIGGYLGDVMSARMRAILSSRYYAKLLSLPQRYFDNTLTGSIIARLTRSITELTQFLQTLSNSFLPMLVTLGAVMMITTWYSWPLTVLLIIIFPLYTWLTAITSGRWQKYEKTKNELVDSAGGAFAEVTGQIKVVKSFVTEDRELKNFNDKYEGTIAQTQAQSKWWHSMDSLRRSSLAIIFFGVHAIILVQTVRGQFSVGTMVMLITLVGMAKMPVGNMSYLVDTAQRAIAGSRDYFAVMDEPEETAEFALASSAEPFVVPDDYQGPAISLSHATFGYDNDQDVLSDISFEIQPGERVALVGESGGGKTTIVNLLLGLYPLRSGSLSLFGRDHTSVDLHELRNKVGVVFQEPALFSGTVRHNIAYSSPQAELESIQSVAERANAAEFITKFADGYDSLIGERGLKLSGGQKQRIAVARAMLKDAPILILDEATSALDTRSERLVQAGLEDLMEGRTSIIIAHRLSTIASVDRIITLKDGRIDEIGTPEELATSGGIYDQLLSLQASSSKQDRKKLASYDIRA